MHRKQGSDKFLQNGRLTEKKKCNLKSTTSNVRVQGISAYLICPTETKTLMFLLTQLST